MICKLCGKEIADNQTINVKRCLFRKKEKICRDCFAKLPTSVKNNVHNFTVNQLARLMSIIHEPTSNTWVHFNDNINIGINSIVLNGWEINRKDIKNISLNFHPKHQGQSDNVCLGICTLIIETQNPHWILEEPIINKEIAVEYSIIGENISYTYNRQLSQAIDQLQRAISENNNFSAIINDLIRKARRKEKSQKEGNNYRTYSDYKNNTSEPLSEFDLAKQKYGLEVPYTLDELRRRKRELMRKVHPDVNKNPEAETEAKEITQMFLVLKKYAKKTNI